MNLEANQETTKTPAFGALMGNVVRPAIVMSHGRGSYLWDEQGNQYLDFVQGWAVNSLGHAPAEVREALSQQAELLLTPSPAFHNRPQLLLAELLVELTAMEKVTFVNSGAEANETAVKLARKWGRLQKGGAHTILTTAGAFHGRTLGMMAASGKPGWDGLFPPNLGGFRKVPYGDVDAMRAAIDDSTVAIMVEPIQGEAGVVVPPPGYLTDLRALCDARELLLILDEVQTGVGRTGRFLAQEHEAVLADITTLGKGLGSGVPVAAVLANRRASCFVPGDHGSTFGGNPLVMSAALAVVETVSQPSFLLAVRRAGDELFRTLSALAAEFGGAQARGRGLLGAIVFERAIAHELGERARDEGLLVNAAQPNVVRFMPELRVGAAELELMAGKLKRAHRLVRAQPATDPVPHEPRQPPIPAGRALCHRLGPDVGEGPSQE